MIRKLISRIRTWFVSMHLLNRDADIMTGYIHGEYDAVTRDVMLARLYAEHGMKVPAIEE